MSATDPHRDVLVLSIDEAGQVVAARETFVDARSVIARLYELAAADVPRVAELARSIVAEARAHASELEALHEWRIARLGYETDEDQAQEAQVLESPLHVLRRGKGDCEDHATLGAALAASLGCGARLVTMGRTPNFPEHCSLAVRARVDDAARPAFWYPIDQRRLPGGWTWSETSVPAAFGEAPIECAERQ